MNEKMTFINKSNTPLDHSNFSFGDKVCSFYKHKDELNQFIIPLISKSFVLKRKIIYVAHDHIADQLLSLCATLNNEIDQQMLQDRFNFITLGKNNHKENKFLPEVGVQLVQKACMEAIGSGFSEILVIHEIGFFLNNISDLDLIIEYESMLAEGLKDFSCMTISLFNYEQFAPEMLDRVIDLYSYCHIDSEIYTNPFYILPEYHATQDKCMKFFNHKLAMLRKNRDNENAIFLNKYEEIKSYLYKLAHDLKTPIRTAHITNNILQDTYQVTHPQETKDLLLIMSKSLVQAYKQIEALEEMTKTICDVKLK
jgi:hypothetical protein